ncbi:hypothetical protein F5884DRAFT_892849 [Xylogone sp. PMI_703]|nr:hypothetical protein F5884DRAFT_892849 [Xylogone sp. PMI_703]
MKAADYPYAGRYFDVKSWVNPSGNEVLLAAYTGFRDVAEMRKFLLSRPMLEIATEIISDHGFQWYLKISCVCKVFDEKNSERDSAEDDTEELDFDYVRSKTTSHFAMTDIILRARTKILEFQSQDQESRFKGYLDAKRAFLEILSSGLEKCSLTLPEIEGQIVCPKLGPFPEHGEVHMECYNRIIRLCNYLLSLATHSANGTKLGNHAPPLDSKDAFLSTPVGYQHRPAFMRRKMPIDNRPRGSCGTTKKASIISRTTPQSTTDVFPNTQETGVSTPSSSSTSTKSIEDSTSFHNRNLPPRYYDRATRELRKHLGERNPTPEMEPNAKTPTSVNSDHWSGSPFSGAFKPISKVCTIERVLEQPLGARIPGSTTTPSQPVQSPNSSSIEVVQAQHRIPSQVGDPVLQQRNTIQHDQNTIALRQLMTSEYDRAMQEDFSGHQAPDSDANNQGQRKRLKIDSIQVQQALNQEPRAQRVQPLKKKVFHIEWREVMDEPGIKEYISAHNLEKKIQRKVKSNTDPRHCTGPKFRNAVRQQLKLEPLGFQIEWLMLQYLGEDGEEYYKRMDEDDWSEAILPILGEQRDENVIIFLGVRLLKEDESAMELI